MWVVSLPTLILGIFTWVFVRYWASFVTNRQLMSDFFKFFIIAHIFLFGFTIWLAIVVFYTFRGIKNWGENVTIASIRPFYVGTVIFLIPDLLASLFFLFTIGNIIREVDNNGDISEPNVNPEDVMDLSDLTLTQSCVFVCAMPCILCIQFADLISALRKAFNRHYFEIFPPKKKSKRSLFRRIYKTLHRLIRGKKTHVLPSDKKGQPASSTLELKGLQAQAPELDREAMERAERERQEQARESRRLEEARQAAEAEDRKRRAEAEAMEAAKEENERLRRELEQQQLKEEQARRGEQEQLTIALTLSAQQFKTLWATLPTCGSFQCKLKTLPALTVLSSHLKSQGFHVVFATNNSSSSGGNGSEGPGLEIGLSNIRFLGSEPWFMARFIATQNTFSAVMKAENNDQVTSYVKKFSLAKVLKIDSSGGGSGK